MRMGMALCCTLFASVARAASPGAIAEAVVAQQSTTALAPDETSLDPIEGATSLDVELLLNAPVITATGREQSRALTPANVVTWEREDILRYGWRSVAEVLSNTPGLYVVDDNVIPSVSVRGVSGGLRAGSRIVRIMINGVQVNFRPDLTAFLGPEYIPIETVERIEIAKGPLSALYGANAFLATVNVITRDPAQGFNAELAGRGHVINGNGGYGGAVRLSYAQDGFSIMAAASADRIDRSGLSLRRTFPAQNPELPAYATFFDRETRDDIARPMSFFAASKLRIGETELSAQGGRQVVDSVAELQPGSVFTHASRIALANNWASLGWVQQVGTATTISASAGWSHGGPTGNEELFANDSLNFSYRRNFSYTAFDFAAAIETRLPFDLELKVGADYTHDSEGVLYYTQIYEVPLLNRPAGYELQRIDPTTPRQRVLSDLGIFAQLGGNPIAALPNLYVLGNVRFDDPNRFESQLSWRAGLAYAFGPHVISKLIAGRAFQTPSGVQLFAQPGFGSSYNVVGSTALPGLPAIQPQSARSVEWATTVAVTDSVVIDGSLYYQGLHRPIELTQVSSSFAARNLDDRDFWGAELGARWSSARLLAFASFSGQFLANDDTNTAGLFGNAAPAEFPSYTIYAGSTLRLPEVYAALALTGRIVGVRGSSSNNTLLNDRTGYVLAPYGTLDFALTSMNLAFFGESRPTQVTVAIHNLTDNAFSQPGHGGYDLPNLGRQFFFRLAQSF